MAEIKVKLTDTQVKCLEYAAYSVQEWCDNAIHTRAKIAQDEIIEQLVAHCNANDIQIATGADKQVAQAYELKLVVAAKDRKIDDAEK